MSDEEQALPQPRPHHASRQQRWRAQRKQSSVLSPKSTCIITQTYANHPFVKRLLLTEPVRTKAIAENGIKQMEYPMSNDGWFRTLFVLEGRALDRIAMPWLLLTINAVVWTVLVQEVFEGYAEKNEYAEYSTLVLNTSLAFLLTFRLNRSAERFWRAREAWGTIIAHGRTLVGGILVHGDSNSEACDNVVRLVGAFGVATMHFMHSTLPSDWTPGCMEGLLTDEEIKELGKVHHQPLYITDEIRWHMKRAFSSDRDDADFATASERSHQHSVLTKHVDGLVLEIGGMERIRATPLPLVYVTHLRTFLVAFLLAMPAVTVLSLGYWTIPIVSLSAFALLGLEGAAQEVESPFLKHRTNHLSMAAYSLTMIKDVTQQVRQQADRQIKTLAASQQESSEIGES